MRTLENAWVSIRGGAECEMYLGVKEALGFQMRAERTLLRDFVRFVEARGEASPIRVQTALDWACAPSARRGRAGPGRPTPEGPGLSELPAGHHTRDRGAAPWLGP